MKHMPCWSQALRRGVGGDYLEQDPQREVEGRAGLWSQCARTQILVHQLCVYPAGPHTPYLASSFQESREDEWKHEWS